MDGPYRAASLPSSNACPRCDGIALRRRAVGHVAVDECPRCGGVFAGNDALSEIVEDLGLYDEVRSAFPAGRGKEIEGGRFYVKCPVCDEVMNRRLFAPGARVIVDACRAHGTWFDVTELPAVVAFVEAGGLEAARRAEAERKAAAAAKVQLDAAQVWGADRSERKQGTTLLEALAELLLWWR